MKGLLLLYPTLTDGCTSGAAAGAGAKAENDYDQARECGDDFDPVEGVRDEDDGCN